MSTMTTSHAPSVELKLALAAVLAGHHDVQQAARERALRGQARVTTGLAMLASLVAMYDLHLLL